MHERLRINHGVGSRTLLDSDNQKLVFHYEQHSAGWVFTIETERTDSVEEVLRLKNELNLFVFKEENGRPVEKVWFYTGDGDVQYDDNNNCLRIRAQSHIAYPADGYLQ
jgi:hypothetical protein